MSFSPLRWTLDLLIANWGTKATALVLAIVFFIGTRDDVIREFTIPLEVIEDRDRLLLSKLPETVTVELHGSWARINRLSSKDLGAATLDLENAEPGPLEVDPATIVMPQGVIFRSVVYDRVDLRFDDVDERSVPILPVVRVEMHADYERVSTNVDPETVLLRGGKRALRGIASIPTEPIEKTGLSSTIEVRKSLILPKNVSLADASGEDIPEVTVRVVVRPKVGERRVETLMPRNRRNFTGIPASYPVTIRGPLPALRAIDKLPTKDVLIAEVRSGDENENEIESSTSEIYVDFALTDALPPEVRAGLSLEPKSKRFAITPIPQ